MACIPEETKIFESTLHKTASNGKTEKCKERIFILAHKSKGPGIKGTRKTLGDVKYAEYILFYRNIGEESPIRVLYLNEKAKFIAESDTKIVKGQKMYTMQLTLSTDTKSRTFFLYTPSKTIYNHWCYHLKTAVQRETPIEQYRHESIAPKILQESERIYSKPCVPDSGYNSKENLYEDMSGYGEEFRQRGVRSYTGPVLSITEKVPDVKRSLTDSQKNRPSEARRPSEASYHISIESTPSNAPLKESNKNREEKSKHDKNPARCPSQISIDKTFDGDKKVLRKEPNEDKEKSQHGKNPARCPSQISIDKTFDGDKKVLRKEQNEDKEKSKHGKKTARCLSQISINETSDGNINVPREVANEDKKDSKHDNKPARCSSQISIDKTSDGDILMKLTKDVKSVHVKIGSNGVDTAVIELDGQNTAKN